ncbi:hypothetical protein L4D06_14755 [Enterovibrio makurazakiensis]|uniref:CHAT domain-containing protein n=1 Tax=Enterovibrio makurazakiensis TaxID=2910232 RepID=UPI003D22BD94
MDSFSKQAEEAIKYSAIQDLYLRARLKKRWFELTESAKELIKNQDASSLAKAEQLLSKALKLGSKEPLAKASACHDLGVLHFSYHSKLTGGTYQNLNKAVQYLSRAINTPQRQHYPDKYTSSLSQLAATYRRAAHEDLWPDECVKCLEKAKSLHEQAIELINKSSIPQAIKDGQLSVVYFNLASVLFDQGMNREACESQTKSVERYLAFQNYNLPQFMNVMRPDQALGLSFARLNHFSDSQKEQDICNHILQVAPSYELDPITLFTINPLVDITRPEEEISYLVRSVESEPSEKNIKKLLKKQFELMKVRQTCDTDAEADQIAHRVQILCSGLARILVSKNDSIKALQLLENCSALRFCESANKHWLVPSDKYSQLLRDDLLQLGATYFNLNELALMLENVDKANIKPVLQSVYETSIERSALDKVRESTLYYNAERYPEVINDALKSNDPINYFRQLSIKCLNDFQKIESLIDHLDPDFAQRRINDNSIDSHDFERALRETPGLTLIRVDIESNYNDALILVAELVNEQVVVTAHSVNLPQELVNHTGEFTKGETDYISTWSLDFINWKDILPIGCKRIGLLTSFFASQIPWIATGLKGKELFTFVDEVNWLPTVLYLCNHVTYFNERRGASCINGGDTHFHDLANRHISNQLSNVSKIDFIDSVRNNEAVAYYGHCAHTPPCRPTLKTKHFDLNDLELVNYISGMNRFEFWACQSGSNIPLSVFSIPVNEAFGFDMRMIEWGAVTSIGSLWALPDIVTAHIKSHYDQLVKSGTSPSKALLAAQRWWVSQGAKAELNKMREIGLTPYLNTLSCNETVDGLLGPMKTKDSRHEDELKHAEKLFLHPSSWAGLRFCGVSEKIKEAVCKEKIDLTADETSQLKSLLAKKHLKSGFINYA